MLPAADVEPRPTIPPGVGFMMIWSPVLMERPDGSRRRYRVSGTAVVDARTTAFGADSDRLLLATCWPLEAPVPGGPLRYLVTAVP